LYEQIDGPWGGKHGRKFIDIATSIRRIKLNYSIGKYALVGPLEVTYELFGISFARKYCDGRNGVHEKVVTTLIYPSKFYVSISIALFRLSPNLQVPVFPFHP
jgi:hypothetical protein